MAQAVSAGEVLDWEFHWTDPGDRSSAASTEARFVLRVRGEDVWPNTGFVWTWIELLEWLRDSWPWLCGEGGLPFRVAPSSTGQLRTWVDDRYAGSPLAQRDRAELVLWEFLAVHDLGQALTGARPPAVVIWREGLTGHVLTATGHTTTEWPLLKGSLERLGDEISARMGQGVEDARALAARQRWKSRDAVGIDVLLSVAGECPGSWAIAWPR